MIPWNLYNLTPRDQAGPLIRPFVRRYEATIGVGVIGTTIILPQFDEERYCLLTAISANMNANAGAVFPRSISFAFRDSFGGIVGNFTKYRESLSGNQTFHATETGSPLVLVPEGWNIEATFTLTAVATSVYTCNVSAFGILIPSGTLAGS